jgi:hypothetical protein
MTQTHDKLQDSLRAFRERNTLIRDVKNRLKGSGLGQDGKLLRSDCWPGTKSRPPARTGKSPRPDLCS